jgi:YHS domain-containing protein
MTNHQQQGLWPKWTFARRMTLRAVCVAAILASGHPVSVASAASGAPVGMPALPGLPSIGETTIVHDAAGVAIQGFDPVAYFDEHRPVGGLARFELVHGGVVWRFASAANMNAFEAEPAAYIPAFGGYDPVAAASGRVVDTTPEFFLLQDGRLFLFRTRDARSRFEQDAALLAAAEREWPRLRRQLAR